MSLTHETSNPGKKCMISHDKKEIIILATHLVQKLANSISYMHQPETLLRELEEILCPGSKALPWPINVLFPIRVKSNIKLA